MKEVVSEWWEVWIRKPGQDPVRVNRNGWVEDFRIPREGYPTKAEAYMIAATSTYGRVVHVVRKRKCT